VQHVTVVGIVVDVVMNNQPALNVHHALEIVRRHLRRLALAHWLSLRLAEDGYLFFAPLQLLLPSSMHAGSRLIGSRLSPSMKLTACLRPINRLILR
jgi:hypothetical protein